VLRPHLDIHRPARRGPPDAGQDHPGAAARAAGGHAGGGAGAELCRRVEVDVLDSGCCGLAGNFGFERGHYEVSAAWAEHGLWPAVRDARPETAVLADGFSCRTQIQAGHLGREGMHLAELLADLLETPA